MLKEHNKDLLKLLLEHIKTSGTTVTGNQVNVTENGTYTVYVADAAGNATTKTIDITNIK